MPWTETTWTSLSSSPVVTVTPTTHILHLSTQKGGQNEAFKCTQKSPSVLRLYMHTHTLESAHRAPALSVLYALSLKDFHSCVRRFHLRELSDTDTLSFLLMCTHHYVSIVTTSHGNTHMLSLTCVHTQIHPQTFSILICTGIHTPSLTWASLI